MAGVVRYVDGIKIIAIDGIFDKNTTPSICGDIRHNAGEKGVEGILLDFAGATNIDTAAFACMIDVIKNTVKTPDAIGVVNLNPNAAGLLKVLRISDIIQKFDSEKDAIAFFKGRKDKGKNG